METLVNPVRKTLSAPARMLAFALIARGGQPRKEGRPKHLRMPVVRIIWKTPLLYEQLGFCDVSVFGGASRNIFLNSKIWFLFFSLEVNNNRSH